MPFAGGDEHLMASPFPIYQPGTLNVQGLNSALKPSLLGDGQFQTISNLRWDAGCLVVRQGIASLVTGLAGSTFLGFWSGTLNGTYYNIYAVVVSSAVQLYSVNLSANTVAELTLADATNVPGWGGNQGDKGNSLGSNATSAGGTRLTGSLTNRIVFTQHTLHRRVVAGTTNPPLDVLSIQNLEDYPLIYSPGLASADAFTTEPLKVFRHKNISLPGGATSFNFFFRGARYQQIANAAATTKYIHKALDRNTNQTRYAFSDTSTAPYNAGSNICLLLTNAASTDQDVTVASFASAVSFVGEQLNFLVEGTPANNQDLLINAKMEIAYDVTTRTNISAVSNTTPAVATAAGHGLSSGDQVLIYGNTVATGINTICYVSVAGANLTLYQDVALTLGIAAGGLNGGGSVAKISRNTFYDSASSDATLAIAPFVTGFDAGNNRFMFTYSLKNIASGATRGCKHLIFTRNGANASTLSTTIFGIWSSGPGMGFYGHTEFWIGWRHRFSDAESKGIAGLELSAELVKNMGGPSVVTSGSSSVAGTKIPVSQSVLYDACLHIPNPAPFGVIFGGLDGVPDTLDIYFRTADEAAADLANPGTNPATYWNSLTLYIRTANLGGTGHAWLLADVWTTTNTTGAIPSPVINVKTELYGWASGGLDLVDRDLRDPGVPTPQAGNTAMLRAAAVGVANQRTFIGAVKDTSSNYQYGDIYISDLGFPFRFVAVQGDSPDSGTYVRKMGERIKAFAMLAAGANGASIIFTLTDQTLNAHGTAGGFVRSGYDATSLGTIVEINQSGTLEPGTVQVYRGMLLYVDQTGQAQLFTLGGAENISRNTVDNVFKSIPAAARGKMTSAIFKDRWYIGYTPIGGAAGNTHVMGYNLVLGAWEFDDTLPSGLSSAQIVQAYDSSQIGSGQVLLMLSGDSKLYSYESGTTEPGSAVGPTLTLTHRERDSPGGLFRWGENTILADAQAHSLTINRYYRPSGGQWQTTVDLTALASDAQASRLDSRVPTEITSTGYSEEGAAGYQSLTGALACGSVLWLWVATIEAGTKGGAVRL